MIPPSASAPTTVSAATSPRASPTEPPAAMLTRRATRANTTPPSALANTQRSHSPVPITGVTGSVEGLGGFMSGK